MKKAESNMIEIILVQGFCPLKIKITQFPDGFRLNCCKLIVSWVKIYCSHHWFTREMKYGWGHFAVKPVSSRNVGCFLGLNLQQNMLFSNPFQRDIVTHLTATNFWINIESKKGLQILVSAMNSHICLSRVHNSIYSQFTSPKKKLVLSNIYPP